MYKITKNKGKIELKNIFISASWLYCPDTETHQHPGPIISAPQKEFCFVWQDLTHVAQASLELTT